MAKRFVSLDFNPPKKVELDDFFLVPITTEIVQEDLEVLKCNADLIIKQRGGSTTGWPTTITYKENYKDLAWLEVCADNNQLFSYVLRRKADDRYIGCLYIYPIDLKFPEKAEKYDVDFSFWITADLYNIGKYDEIFSKLYEWLVSQWPFKKDRIYVRNIDLPKGFVR